MRHVHIALAGAALVLGGCWETTSRSRYTPEDPIRLKVTPEAVQANSMAATRVDSLGRAILAANPRLDAKPLFQTIGSPQPEIFHNGTSRIVITQALVESCKTDAELAAVLCFELGRMVAEREAVGPLKKYPPTALPPIDPGVPAGVVGVGATELFRLPELARFDEERKAAPEGTLPDPFALARTYLRRTGFAPESLDRVKPQLRVAAGNSQLEGQLAAGSSPAPFTPPVR